MKLIPLMALALVALPGQSWATPPDDSVALLAATQASDAPDSSEAIIADAWMDLIAPRGRTLETDEVDWLATRSMSSIKQVRQAEWKSRGSMSTPVAPVRSIGEHMRAWCDPLSFARMEARVRRQAKTKSP